MAEQVTFQIVFQFLQTVGILVGVYYYIMTIRANQKNQELTLKAQEQAAETRQAQLLMQFTDKISRPEVTEARRKYEEFEWSTAEDYIRDYKSVEGRQTIALNLAFWEGLGVLVKLGLFDIQNVALLVSGTIRYQWEKFMPVKDEVRELLNSPRSFIECEYLYNELMKFHKEHPEVPM